MGPRGRIQVIQYHGKHLHPLTTLSTHYALQNTSISFVIVCVLVCENAGQMCEGQGINLWSPFSPIHVGSWCELRPGYYMAGAVTH